MKDFFKYMLATIMGLIVTGVLLTILGIISLAGIIASSNTNPVIKPNSIFVLSLKGNIVERYQATPLEQWLGDELSTYGLDDILSSIEKAKKNEKIEGIYLNPGMFNCSAASLQSIRRALIDFKENGKFIIAYSDSYTQGGYYLATAADKVIVNPSGTLAWHGLSAQTIFFKDLMNKLGIEMQIFRVGTYKSAVEPFIATEMSEANRQQTQAFINSTWNQLLTDVSLSRNISTDSLNWLADQNMDFQPAEKYIEYRLADELMYKDQVLELLKSVTGTPLDNQLKTISLEDMINLTDYAPKEKTGNIIAVYYAYGEIDAGYNSYEGINSEKVCHDLRQLREDENVKAVVLRVNSPGGSAYGSEQIWREVSLLKTQKPVVVSMGDYAASGGYYISCAADWIVAEPTTLTGSIGIFGMIPNAEQLITKKLGIHFDGVKSNRLADMGNLTRAFTTEESNLIQQMVDNGYQLFTKRCAEGRSLSMEEIRKIAEGRIWTGEMAKEIKLVDELGDLNSAIRVAQEKAAINNYTLISYPEKGDILTELLQTTPERYIHSLSKNYLGEWYSPISFLKEVDKKDQLQARMPFTLMLQ